MTGEKKRILIVEDDPGVRDAYLQILSPDAESGIKTKGRDLFPDRDETPGETVAGSYELTMTKSGEEGVKAARDSMARQTPYAAAFVDMMMPGIDGAETARQIWHIDPDVKIVIVTAYSDYKPDDMVRLVGRDDLFYLRKPFNSEEIRQFARALTNQWDLEREKNQMSSELRLANRQLKNYAEDLQKTFTELKQAHEKLALLRDYEIDTASKIQQTLLLGAPPEHMPGIQVIPWTVPSQKVDGDFIDFFRLGDRVLDVVLGDVMGKGVPAGLIGAAMKSQLLRALIELIQEGFAIEVPPPDRVVANVQHSMIRQLQELETFVTLCYARFDLAENVLSFVDCGHTITIHFKRQVNACQTIEGVDMPLGFPENDTFTRVSVPFNPEDLFLFYSDGLTEAKAPSGELYGEERLLNCVARIAHKPVNELVQHIWQDVVQFSGTETFGDDFTCVVVRIE